MNHDNPLSARIGQFRNLADLGDQFELEHRFHTRAQQQASKLITDISKRAATVFYRPTFDTTVAGDIAETLDNDGFDPRPENGEHTTTILLPPRKFHELEGHVEQHVRIEPSPDPSAISEHEIYGMRIALEQKLPEGTGVAIHEDAIAANPRIDSWRPFVVRHGKGIVRIQFHD